MCSFLSVTTYVALCCRSYATGIWLIMFTGSSLKQFQLRLLETEESELQSENKYSSGTLSGKEGNLMTQFLPTQHCWVVTFP